jgi:streptogramin lyase
MRIHSPYERKLCVLVTALALGFLMQVAQAPAQVVTDFPIPDRTFSAFAITAGPDGNLWFLEDNSRNNAKVGRITPQGIIREFFLNTLDHPSDITAGPDGNLWFTKRGFLSHSIVQITPSGLITKSFGVSSEAKAITSGPDGNLWFTETLENKIGRITLTGGITEYPLPAAGSEPFRIAAGSDGNIWFTEYKANKIGRITPAGAITEFALAAESLPYSIASGPDGNMWFTEAGANKVGVITPEGVITEFPLPHAVLEITTGPDGNLWAVGGNATMRITTAGIITEFPLIPSRLATGPDGNLWSAADEVIRRFEPPPVPDDLLAALLPARSVQVGSTASAFVTMLNATATTMKNCGPALVTSVPANFSFQATDPANNTLTGLPNRRVDIAAHAPQTFAVFFKANAPFSFRDVQMGYSCDGATAGSIVGVNTFPLTFSATPVPDLITVNDTSSHDGYANIPGIGGTGIMVTAATNIGVAGNLTVQVRLLDPTTPIRVSVCETFSSGPQFGNCKASPAPTIDRSISSGENTTWTAFFTPDAPFRTDPARIRALFEFIDVGSSTVRGQTSIALKVDEAFTSKRIQ